MGVYRVLNLSESRSSTLLINQIDSDIKLISHVSIKDIYKSTLVYDIAELKKHLDCDITKCPVGLSIIESTTISFCKDLVATHNNIFKGYARELLRVIIDELGPCNYNGILKDYYIQLKDEKYCVSKSSPF